MAGNQDLLLQDLKESIVSRNALVVAGAGVSLAATGGEDVASWTGLLRNGVARCEEFQEILRLPPRWGERVREEIDSGDLDDLLSAAEKISTKLIQAGQGEYSRWLRETVGGLRPSHPEIGLALDALNIPLATTNYDGLLTAITGKPAVTWMDGAKVQRVLRGDERGILHFHGYWDEADSVVLGVRSYEKILGNGAHQALQQSVGALKSLIFVGCGDGLRDPNFGALLEWITRFSGSEYRHFRLCRTSEVSTLQASHPPEQRIFVLPFGEDHADLVPFLQSLSPGKNARTANQETAHGAPNPDKPISRLPPRRSCVGRETEIKAVVDALLAAPARPISVRGAPGIGKSTVAIAALHHKRIIERFGTRRCFIRCEGLASREALLSAIAQSLDIVKSGDPETNLLNNLEKAPCCLVFDNFETPWDADPLNVEDLLAKLAGINSLAFAITSRVRQQPLGVAWQEPVEVLSLKHREAEELFLSIAGKKHAQDPHLSDLLAVSDGVPLALILLGHLAEAEPHLSDLWARWQSERTHLLTRGHGNSPELSAAVSFELSLRGPRMSDSSRQALAILATLPSGLAHSDIPACLPGFGAAISALRRAGLVYDEANRLRMLAPLREYILDMSPADSCHLEPVIKHFLELAENHCRRILRDGGGEAVRRLLPETNNIERMLSIALNGPVSENAIVIAAGYGSFVAATGCGSSSIILEALTKAEEMGYVYETALCLSVLGNIALARSDNEGAKARYEAALPLYRNVDNILGVANCIWSLGDTALRCSDLEGSKARSEEALPMYRLVGNVLGEANCIRSLGDIALRRSDQVGAKARYEEALPLYRQIEDVLGKANCIKCLGDIALECLDHEGARACYEEALPMYMQIGDVLGKANCIRSLGDIELAHSNLKGAQARYDEALPMYRQIGGVLGQANCIQSMGDIAMHNWDHKGAQAFFEEALPLYMQIGNVLGEGNCIQSLGVIAARENSFEAARTLWNQALNLFRRIPEPYSLGVTYSYIARIDEIDTERKKMLALAVREWRFIGRTDLVQELLQEFLLTEDDLILGPDDEPETGPIKSPA